jgi:triosephosphate isomerase
MARRKRYLIAGNWKMNVSSSDAENLISGIVGKIADITQVDVLVCPPFTSIPAVKNVLKGSGNIFLGAQNFYPEKNGAYTGEVSAVMLREIGVSHVIIGHSERRTYFKEDDELINRKVRFALGNSLIPILCVGESLEQRKNGKAFATVRDQIEGDLAGVGTNEAKKLIIAYEPVWAIGTGEVATVEIVQEMHSFIRELLKKAFDGRIATSIKILYGGSMKADNAKALLGENDVDGGLIGGASIVAPPFAEIVKIASKLSM